MKNFNNKDVAIITTQTVEKTFENIDAYLQGIIKIVKDDEQAEMRTYKVRTDLVGYQDVLVPKFDTDGNQELDPQTDEPLFETKEQMVWLEQKQDWSVQIFSYAEIDGFIQQLAPMIPTDLTRTQQDNYELNLMFLIQRQTVAPWGIEANKWRIRTNEDLLKTK